MEPNSNQTTNKMKRLSLKCIGLYRMFALLLAALCGYATAAALESDDINAAILVEGSVPVKWTNDAQHPWYIPEGESYIRTPQLTGNDSQKSITTTLTFSYSSQYPTELTCEWYFWNYYGDGNPIMKIDGVDTTIDTYHAPWIDVLHMLPAGNHTVELISTFRDYHVDDGYFMGLRNLRVWECKELETACLKEGSMELKFENDPDHMWIAENGYIRSTTENTDGEATSKISTTFTIDKPSLFSFECRSYNYNYRTNVTIDGVIYKSYLDGDWQYASVVLYPGTHTVDIENWQLYSSQYHVTEIRNVCLDQTWYDVTLNNPGELGVRLLQALGDKNLQDAELVKISGTMNSDDWTVVSQLSGVKAIDFSNTDITLIPEKACNGLSYLSTVMLPETLIEIGNNAFYGTDFHKVTIPASVEKIGREVWSRTPLQYIDFAEKSNLKYIGHAAFNSTNIIEFIMPNSVTKIGRYAGYDDELTYSCELFRYCSSLKKLHLSDGLDRVCRDMAYGTSSLEDLHLPMNCKTIEANAFYGNTVLKTVSLPASLLEIGDYAFRKSGLVSVEFPENLATLGSRVFENCTKLQDLRLNSHCWAMDGTFSDCTSLKTVVLPCATPPSTGYSKPFEGVNLSNVTLTVPDFALESYRKDSYWYNFTNTVAGDEASISDYWALRGNLTLNSEHLIQGTPDLEMMTGSTLTIDAATQQNFSEFIFNTNESAPAAFLSRSNALSANRIQANFYVENKDKWYFFSPVTDVNMADIKYPATDAWVIRYYDGGRRASENATSGNWINMPADGTLKRGEGYIIQAKEAGWLNLPAASNEEHAKFLGSNEVTLELADNPCETEANAGWNLVANPYPAFYDIYYINMQAPITVWTGSTYRAYSLNDGDRGDDTFVLRPMQPFFVQKASEDLTASMPLVGRQISTAIDRTKAPAREVIDENRHKLNLELISAENEEADDYTRIVINDNAKTEYESACDASKFMSLDTEVAQIFSLGAGSHPMAINERPYGNGNVALGVFIPSTGVSYRIAATRCDRKAWLYDAETGMEQDLTEGDYIFTSSKTGVDNNRFSIRFAPSATGVESVNNAAVKVAGNIGSISVTAPTDCVVTVYTADGATVAVVAAEDGNIEIPVAAGIYVVKVDGETFKTIVK